jgi:hypothetical protein
MEKNPRGLLRVRRFSSKLKGAWTKPTSALIKWLLNESRPLSIQKYSFFFWPPSAPIKNIQFFDPHEDLGFSRPRFSRENWTLVNNPRSQPLKVLFQPRINQIWPAQISHCPFNEIWFGGLSERMMIIRMIQGQISGYQRTIRSSLEPFSGLWNHPDSSSETCRHGYTLASVKKWAATSILKMFSVLHGGIK